MKIALILLVTLVVLLGGTYGLAKVQVIPTQKLASKNPALARLLRPIGLYSPPPPAPPVAPAAPVVAPAQLPSGAPSELAGADKTEPKAQHPSDEKSNEKSNEKSKTETVALDDKDAQPDPQATAKMAGIFEQMPANKIVPIFNSLNKRQIIALLRIMDEKKVSDILTLQPPEKAAEYTRELVKPAPDLTASASP